VNTLLEDDPDKTPQIGVIAQDVERKHPDAVFEGDDGYLRVGVSALRRVLK
jgi:hypothetical protein